MCSVLPRSARQLEAQGFVRTAPMDDTKSEGPGYRSFWRDGVVNLFLRGATTATIDEFSPPVRIVLRLLLFALFLAIAVPIGGVAAYVWWLMTFATPTKSIGEYIVGGLLATFIASVAIAFLGKLLTKVLPSTWWITKRLDSIAESRFRIVVAFCLLLVVGGMGLIVIALVWH